jgi:hypothetical protein
MSFCTVGAPLTPIAPTTSPFTVTGNPPPHAAMRENVGIAGQKRRVALDKVEKILRRDAEQSCVRFILRHLNGRDRRPVHPAERLEISGIIENHDFSLTPISLAFATAAATIFCASSKEMLCFFTRLSIGHLPSIQTAVKHSFRHPR